MPLLDAPAPADRPLLSRAADSAYWMARYMERAEHVARVLLVNSNLLIDVGDLAPELQERQWVGVLKTFHVEDVPAGDGTVGERCVRHLTFDTLNPNSLLSCLTRARENARAVRESISVEMWECLNALYWSLRADDAEASFHDHPEGLYDQVTNGSMLFQGLTDQTLGHDQRWLFTQLAKYFERVDVTCRVLETRYEILQGEAGRDLDPPVRNIHWMGVLRMCCGIEAYRRQHVSDLDPLRVATFLILEPNFPRSIRWCVERAASAVSALRAATGGSAAGVTGRNYDAAERVLGRLATQLEFADPSEVTGAGVPEYLAGIRDAIETAARHVQLRYFLH